jgi:dipeptidyl aminopeptidase/acylaminoacyl peptidase
VEDVGWYYGGPYAFSADGHRLAFTRVRPKKTLANHKWEYLWGNAGGDVWVQLDVKDQPFNITNGAQDGSGWWSPQWSPDGRKLAMLSTRGGNVRVWVWDVNTRQLRQLSTRGVDLVDVRERPYLWVDSEHLLYPALPGDEQPEGMKVELQTPMIATAAWPKVQKGEEATASVLESGVPIDLSKRPQGDLLLIDASTGSEKVIAHGSTQLWQLSPNGKTVVFTRQISVYTPKANELLPFDFSGLSTIELATLEGTPVAVQGELSRDVLRGSVRWSPDGNELAFFAYAAGREEPPLLYQLNVSNQTLVRQSLKSLDVVPIVREEAQLEWTTSGDLILLAAKRVGDAKPDVTTRRDWWLVAKDGTQRCLTEGIKTPPHQLWPQDGRQAFVGLADGKIWRIEPASGKVEDLTAQFAPKIASISWPAKTNEGTDEYRHPGQTYGQIIFSVQDSEVLSPYLLDLRSAKITPIEKPAPDAGLVAYEPFVSTGIFYASDRNGLQVWRSDLRHSKSTALVQANGFLRDIAEGTFKSIEYTSLNGQKLKAWLLLPLGYQSGKRYPLLTWVYAGSVAGDRPSRYITIASSICLNEQIPAARGYAVLMPSMPLSPEGATDDPMLRLPEGVIPAVDKVIEMGIADPNRLFLMGQSFGGFSTYGLVTQTQRFKAAVSLAGLSDLISLYGQFDARVRYTEYPQEDLFMAALMESAQSRMGNPPWKDLGRYIRNSPIFYVDRVQTPLMIIQGDMDYVAMQQGEEFFTSLYRQGKRAKFVRYWGEGHVLESPANIRDMWNQIFAWFDEFSKEEQPGTGESPRN